MIVRRELPTDADAVRAVHLAAFAKAATDDAPAREGTLEADLVDELRADGDLVPECCLVVEVDGVQGAGDAGVGERGTHPCGGHDRYSAAGRG